MTNITPEARAQILSEAMPYIRRYNGKTVVIKYGGNAMISDELKRAVIEDIVLLSLVGVNVVVVHGGGPEISALLKKTGKESRFVNGLRYTDEETMDAVQMVLAGKINKDLVSLITKAGGRAIGLSGVDGGMLKAVRLIDEDGTEYGLVGNVTAVDPAPVNDTIAAGYIPVISTVAESADDEGKDSLSPLHYNINADTAAAKLAVAMGAEKLILLTDVRGVLREQSDDSTLISQIPLADVEALVRDGVISGGMIPKLDCCVEAVNGGVRRAHILDGRIPHSILIEVLSHAGIGTMIF